MAECERVKIILSEQHDANVHVAQVDVSEDEKEKTYYDVTADISRVDLEDEM